jgi:hypothetical protein
MDPTAKLCHKRDLTYPFTREMWLDHRSIQFIFRNSVEGARVSVIHFFGSDRLGILARAIELSKDPKRVDHGSLTNPNVRVRSRVGSFLLGQGPSVVEVGALFGTVWIFRMSEKMKRIAPSPIARSELAALEAAVATLVPSSRKEEIK